MGGGLTGPPPQIPPQHILKKTKIRQFEIRMYINYHLLKPDKNSGTRMPLINLIHTTQICLVFAASSSILMENNVNTPDAFNRPWLDFKNGFGDSNGNYWLGNDAINNYRNGHQYQLYIYVYVLPGICSLFVSGDLPMELLCWRIDIQLPSRYWQVWRECNQRWNGSNAQLKVLHF